MLSGVVRLQALNGRPHVQVDKTRAAAFQAASGMPGDAYTFLNSQQHVSKQMGHIHGSRQSSLRTVTNCVLLHALRAWSLGFTIASCQHEASNLCGTLLQRLLLCAAFSMPCEQ